MVSRERERERGLRAFDILLWFTELTFLFGHYCKTLASLFSKTGIVLDVLKFIINHKNQDVGRRTSWPSVSFLHIYTDFRRIWKPLGNNCVRVALTCFHFDSIRRYLEATAYAFSLSLRSACELRVGALADTSNETRHVKFKKERSSIQLKGCRTHCIWVRVRRPKHANALNTFAVVIS